MTVIFGRRISAQEALEVEVKFVAMTAEHRAEVMDIFNYYIENGFSAYPESRLPEEFFVKLLEVTKGYPAFVMVDAGSREIVGFCFLRAYNRFSTFRKTAEITYFIREEYTGKGLGRLALQRLETEAEQLGISVILASISSRNERSIAFHNKNGFSECGRFRGIGEKQGTTFDVVWMQKDLS